MRKCLQSATKGTVPLSLGMAVLGLCLGSRAAIGNDTVTVTVQPMPAPTIQTFDPQMPPDDLAEDDAADAQPFVQAAVPNFSGPFDGTTLTIDTVSGVTVSGSVTLRLPTDASAALKSHEQGHYDLNKDEYDRTAKTKVENAMRGFKGMTFTGVGATAAERQKSAEDQASAEATRRSLAAAQAILDQMHTLNTKYDELTDKGRSQTVNTAQGKEMAKKELGLAAAAGTTPLTPDSRGPVAGTAEPPELTFDPVTLQLSFNLANSLLDFSSAGASDPILGATLSLSPLQMIGPQENGTIQFATSEFHLSQGGVDLLHGHFIETAYMPSTLPGFAGMIQGYLDVPPAFTGAGINNAIGSPFLSSYQTALDDAASAGRSTLWFFTDRPLFDSSGNVLSTSSTGELKFGIGVPEPSSAVLWACSLLALHAGRAYRASRSAKHKTV